MCARVRRDVTHARTRVKLDDAGVENRIGVNIRMKIPSKRAAAVVLLVCLSGTGLSCSRGAEPGASGVLSARPSPASAAASPSPESDNRQAEVKSPLPKPSGFVNDYANVFDDAARERLESVLKELKEKAGIEFALVTVETTEGQPISDYSLALANGWGVGPKDSTKGGGLLLMLATTQREWRLQVSRSLEKDLPDEETKRLGEQSRELYQEGKYAEGITKYVAAIIKRLEETRGFKLDRELSVN